MSRLVDFLKRACSELNLKCVSPHSVTIRDGVERRFDVWLPELGAKNGMLVLRDSEFALELSDDLVRLGYGYSVLDEPLANEVFDLEDYVEMFSDWGWSGAKEKEPDWIS